MSITVDKTENGFSIEFKSEKITTFIKGLTKSDMKDLCKQIKDITKEPKLKEMIWNPRANRHEYVDVDPMN